MNELEALPRSGNAAEWTDSEKALVEAAGLVSRGQLAPRPTVEAFLHHCRRTGLDPIARQIYAIERGGRWNIQVSIDGARLVAERSKQYRGQTPVQWTADGVAWVDVWLSKDKPAAARAGVYREGFVEPLYAVATFDAYSAGGPMWNKMPALMLGKCAEMLALRKAFPQDLSGLYSSEEMDQASPAPQQEARPVQKPAAVAAAPALVEVAPGPDLAAAAKRWLNMARSATTKEGIEEIFKTARAAGEMSKELHAGLRDLAAAIPDVPEPWAAAGEPAAAEWVTAPIPEGDSDVPAVLEGMDAAVETGGGDRG